MKQDASKLEENSMNGDRLYHIYKGLDDSKKTGRLFVRLYTYMTKSRELLENAISKATGPDSLYKYTWGNTCQLPKGHEKALIAKLDEITPGEHVQSMQDRIPIAISDEEAKNISFNMDIFTNGERAHPISRTNATDTNLGIGKSFDFGGALGEMPITGIGPDFIIQEKTIHDDRIVPGQRMVYIYNANAPICATDHEYRKRRIGYEFGSSEMEADFRDMVDGYNAFHLDLDAIPVLDNADRINAMIMDKAEEIVRQINSEFDNGRIPVLKGLYNPGDQLNLGDEETGKTVEIIGFDRVLRLRDYIDPKDLEKNDSAIAGLKEVFISVGLINLELEEFMDFGTDVVLQFANFRDIEPNPDFSM